MNILQYYLLIYYFNLLIKKKIKGGICHGGFEIETKKAYWRENNLSDVKRFLQINIYFYFKLLLNKKV